MITRASVLTLALLLTGCITTDSDPVLKHPDHRIVVAPAAPGSKTLKAYAPECPVWTDHRPDPYDNMPQPQIGCANQRNLALMIDQPADLVAGRKLGPADAARSSSATQRYRDNKVTGLYDPNEPPPAKE